MRISRLTFLGAFVLIGGLVSAGVCEDGAGTTEKTGELVRRQRMTKQDFEKLTAEMVKLADELDEKDPASARILREAVDRARGAYAISQDMDKVAEYLLKGLTELASRTESGVIERLREIHRLLREGILDTDSHLETVRDWEAIRREIDTMIGDQEKLERTSALQNEADRIEAQLRSLDARMAELAAEQQKLLESTEKLEQLDAGVGKLAELRDKIGRLIRRQKELREAAEMADDRRMPVVGKMQKDLAADAEKVGKDIERAAKDDKVRKAVSGVSGGAKAVSDSAGKVGEAAGQMRQAAKSLDASDGETASGAQQGAEEKLEEAHKKLSDLIARASASTPAGKLSKRQGELGDKTRDLAEDVKKTAGDVGMPKDAPDLSKAARHMDQAGERLAGQDARGAAGQQKKALEELKKKRDELAELHRRTRERLAKTPKQQEAEQSDLARRAGSAAERMKGSQGSESMPGQESVKNASKSMSDASGQLSKNDSAGANKSQNDALERLKRARDMLDQAIAREKAKLQDESLVKIDIMLEEILKRQRAISGETTGLHSRRSSDGYGRADQMKLAGLSSKQGSLGAEVRKVAQLLAKEGTTVVFPAVLDEVREDMLNVSKLLADKQAGLLTQEIQAGVEQSLKEMIDSLRKELSKRRKNSAGGGSGAGCGGGGGKAPLVPPVAELRMLLRLQLQINRRTAVIAAQKADGALPAEQDATQHKKLAEREEKVQKMTAEIKEKLTSQPPEEFERQGATQ